MVYVSRPYWLLLLQLVMPPSSVASLAETFRAFMSAAYDGRLYGKEFVGERVQCGAIIVSSFVSRVERSGFSQESVYLARFVNVDRYVLKHYRRLFGHTSALAFFIRPFIFPCTLQITPGGCKWSALPFTRASATLRERITDFHRVVLHRGACGRGRARLGSFILKRVIEISCNVIIAGLLSARSPFRTTRRT